MAARGQRASMDGKGRVEQGGARVRTQAAKAKHDKVDSSRLDTIATKLARPQDGEGVAGSRRPLETAPAQHPYLHGVDDVLPKYVTPRSYRRQRMQERRGNPDGEGRVFLSKGLASLVGLVEIMADATTRGKLNDCLLYTSPSPRD